MSGGQKQQLQGGDRTDSSPACLPPARFWEAPRIGVIHWLNKYLRGISSVYACGWVGGFRCWKGRASETHKAPCHMELTFVGMGDRWYTDPGADEILRAEIRHNEEDEGERWREGDVFISCSVENGRDWGPGGSWAGREWWMRHVD